MKKLFAVLAAGLVSLPTFAQTFPSPTFNSVTLQNPLAVSGGGTGSTASTGTGSVVLATSPSIASPTVTGSLTATGLVTPADLAIQAANTVLANVAGSTASPTAITVPSCSTSGNALTWTSGAGFTCATGIALTANPLSQFAATTSAQLAGVLSDETGTGVAVFNVSPALTAPVINGGTINNASVGATTPSTGAFTTLTSTSTPTVGAATIFPTVASNAMLEALPTTLTSTVTRLGFTTAGDIPALVYQASASACSLNSGAGDNGSQVQSANGKCWLASFPSGNLDTREWGAVAAGAATDNTTALQAAWNYGASVNRNILLPPSTTTNYVRISTLTAPTPVSLNAGNRSALVGYGAGETVLQSTVGNGVCAIVLSATFGVNSAYNNTFRDFTLLGTSYAGDGICLSNVTHAVFSGLYIGTFQNGVFAQDTLDVAWIEDVWSGFSNDAVDAAFVTNTYPNAWTFIDPHVFFAVNAGLIFQNPADLNILGGDWENNNISGTVGSAAIVINGNPINGTKGLNVSGGYFSINAGAADIVISDVSTSGGASNLNGVHTINGAEFDRVGTTQIDTNNVLIDNTGTGITTVNVRGNGFQGFSGYVPSASRLYVAEATPSSSDYIINSGGNWFQSSTETPTGAWWEETGWTAYTPTLSCGSGSLTTASATGSYKRLTEKTISVQTVITVTTLGTCATTLNFSLPTTANSIEEGMLRNTASNISGSITTASGSATAAMLSATGTLPVASSNTVNGSLVYESQ